MTNTKRATHDGTCQICGSFQRLPGGVLAKHGYTTKWGFFSGTCYGSGELPFEVSIHLIVTAIDNALEQVKDAKAEAAALRDPQSAVNAKATAWWHQFVPATWKVRHSSYKWVTVTVSADGQTITLPEPTDRGVTTEGLYRYSIYTKTQADAVLALNSKRADAFDQRVKQLEQYVFWQRERIANWTPTPLKPRKG